MVLQMKTVTVEVSLLEKTQTVRLIRKFGLFLTHPQIEEDVIRKISAIWFPSSSAFVCSARTAMGEEIICVVCASCAARGGHVKPVAVVPHRGHAAVMDEKESKRQKTRGDLKMTFQG